MRKLLRYIKRVGKVACVALVVMQLVIPATTQAFADEDKITLGTFVLHGINSSSEQKPTWFSDFLNKHGDELDQRKTVSFEVTKEQADEVTRLFADGMTPLMFTPQEFKVLVADMRGLDKLSNLRTIGFDPAWPDDPGLFFFPFSKEQIETLYEPLADYFADYDVERTWPNFDITTAVEHGGLEWPVDKSLKEKLIAKADKKTQELKDKVADFDLPQDKKDELNVYLDKQHKKYLDDLESNKTGKFYYYLKRYEPTIDPSYAADELYIQKEKVKYELEALADEQRKEFNKDPEKFADDLEDLNRKLQDALASIDKAADVEELRRIEDEETPEIATSYQAALVAEAERLAKLAQDAVTGADTDHNGQVSAEEKAVADKAIADAQTAYDVASQAVAELPDGTPGKEELKARLAQITIPASPELTPSKPVSGPDQPGYPPYIPPTAEPAQPLNVSSVSQLEKHEVLPQTSDKSLAYGVYVLTGALSLLLAYGLKRVVSVDLKR